MRCLHSEVARHQLAATLTPSHMKAFAGLLIFVVLPIAFVLAVGGYFGKLDRELKLTGKPFSIKEVWQRMSRRARASTVASLIVLLVANVALRAAS